MGEAIFAPEKGQRPDEMRSANGAYSAICTRQMAILRELNSPGGAGLFVTTTLRRSLREPL